MLAEILEDEKRHAALARSSLQFVEGGGTFATTNDLKMPVTAVLEKVVQMFHNRVGAWKGFWAANTLPLYAYLTDRLQSAAPAKASAVQYWKSLLERLFAEDLAAEGSPASVRSAEDTRVFLRLLDATWEADSVLQDSETRKISAEELNQRANRQDRAGTLGGQALRRFFEWNFENLPERFLDMVEAATSKQPSLRDSIAFWASVVMASKDIRGWEQIALKEGSELTRNRALAIAYSFKDSWDGLPRPSDTNADWGFDPELYSDPEVACAWSARDSESLDCITFGDWESHPIRHRNFLLRAVGSEVLANAMVLYFVPDRMLDEDFVKIAREDEEALFDEDTRPCSYMVIREKIPGFKGSPMDVECLRQLADYRSQ